MVIELVKYNNEIGVYMNRILFNLLGNLLIKKYLIYLWYLINS